MTIYTIGHSNLPGHEFVSMLRHLNIPSVVDVRSHRSSKWEQWADPTWINDTGIEYKWFRGLGGWDVRHAPMIQWLHQYQVDLRPYLEGYFPRQHIASDRDVAQVQDSESKWTNQGLHDYAWYSATAEFIRSLDLLVQTYQGQDVAIFCSEVLWWKCHRSMIADALSIRHAIDAQHIMPTSAAHGRPRVSDHQAGDRIIRYPQRVLDVWTGRL